jgi:hypothetical protein
MSGHLRSCFAAFLLTSLSTSAAFSNPFTDLFSSASKEQATAPAPAEEGCSPKPGRLTADGQHWVYRFEGYRKCWFQTARGAVAGVKKRVHRHGVNQRVTAREMREAALQKHGARGDARAELFRSALEEMSKSTPSVPEFKVVDVPSVAAMGAAPLVPPAPAVELTPDQLTPDRSTPRPIAVETLRVSRSANDTIDTSVLSAIPVALPPAEVSDDGRGWPANQLGMLIMALGLVSLLSGSLPMLVGLFSRSA